MEKGRIFFLDDSVNPWTALAARSQKETSQVPSCKNCGAGMMAVLSGGRPELRRKILLESTSLFITIKVKGQQEKETNQVGSSPKL